jgi:Family of unknown function (DUF6069)
MAPVLAVTAAAALLANLAAYAVGRVAGVDFDVVSMIGDRPETVGPRAIAVMTLAPWLVGSLTLVLTRRWAAGVWPWLGWAGAGLALVTVPFFNQAELATKVNLAIMHMVAGGLWFGAVRHLAREHRVTVGTAPK